MTMNAFKPETEKFWREISQRWRPKSMIDDWRAEDRVEIVDSDYNPDDTVEKYKRLLKGDR